MAKAYAGAADAATTGRGFRATALATLCVDGVAEGLAGLEDRHPPRGDGEGFAGLWIAARACRAVAGSEFPEAVNGDRLAPGEGAGNGGEDGAGRGGGIGPRQRCCGGDGRAKVGSVHGFSPVCARRTMVNEERSVVEAVRVWEGGHGGEPGQAVGRGEVVERGADEAAVAGIEGGSAGVTWGAHLRTSPSASRIPADHLRNTASAQAVASTESCSRSMVVCAKRRPAALRATTPSPGERAAPGSSPALGSGQSASVLRYNLAVHRLVESGGGTRTTGVGAKACAGSPAGMSP